MNILDNGVEVYGINDIIPYPTPYFKEFDFQIIKDIVNINQSISKILSFTLNLNIGERDIITTPIMISNDGTYLSGYKLKVEILIDLKIKYMLNTPEAIGFYNDKLIKTIYIVLPTEYKDNNMIDLLRRKKISIVPYIEDIYCELKTRKKIYSNISAIIICDFIEF